jgi:hypothetical protein
MFAMNIAREREEIKTAGSVDSNLPFTFSCSTYNYAHQELPPYSCACSLPSICRASSLWQWSMQMESNRGGIDVFPAVPSLLRR